MPLTGAHDGLEVSVGVSVGVAVAPQHGRTFGELLQHADHAMYRVKRERTPVG